MARIIFVPQLPVKMRYQEWWFKTFRKELRKRFDEVVILGDSYYLYNMQTKLDQIYNNENFSSIDYSIAFEQVQIQQYMNLDLRHDDVLLIGDISFPGLFCNILFIKKPKKCFAICHASAKNKYDIWQEVAEAKWMQESGISQLMSGIFVATDYHRRKLKWLGTHVVALPFNYRYKNLELPINNSQPDQNIVSASRICQQKVDRNIEKKIEDHFKLKIERIPDMENITWEKYYKKLASSSILLITSHEETFGYQIADAVLGTTKCVPIAPRQCSYPELLPDEYLYDRHNIDEAINKIEKVFNKQLIKPDKLLNQELVDNFFQNMCDIMLGK